MERASRNVLCLVSSLLLAVCLAGCIYMSNAEQQGVPLSTVQLPSNKTWLAGYNTPEPCDSPRALLIEDARFALTSRIDLIDAAVHSIDVQYFIWNNDPTGILVIEKILRAADRGVYVRALLDDIFMQGLVSRLNVLNAHPNIEIRIFNPFSLRVLAPFELFRVAEFAIDGNRLNHRMHNKLLVTENKLAILGGRNIGDDYFGFSTRRNFIDTDILLSGSVVGELSDGFDDYWNSRWAYPVEELASFSMRKDDLELLRGRIDKRLAEHPELLEVLNESDFRETMQRLCSAFPLQEAGTVIDDPEVRWFERPDDIAADLAVIAKTVEREVLVVSPYFVPTENMFQIAKELNERGVKIVIVTNSLASNDIVIAHSAYARFRKAILKAGVELYEMRGEPRLAEGDKAEIASLHSKYIIFDDDVVFIGSLNLDPRSLYLNTELGVMLRSPELADALRLSFQELIRPENSWRITMEDGGLCWSSAEGVVKKEPAKSHWQSIQNKLMRTLPLADQL